MSLRPLLLLSLTTLAACASAPPPPPAHSDALWRLIERDCQGAQGPRGACLQVQAEADRRDVLVKDSHGDYQFLLMPLDKVSGIESQALYRRGVPNYFAAAWQARTHTQQALAQPLPREVASLALNSPHGRSQHQLHIHVDCLRADVVQALADHDAALGTRWAPLPVPLRGHQYQARLLPGAELTANPLNLLAYDLSGPADVGNWSLLVAGHRDVQGGPGFILLATRLDPATGNDASSEELQDHACSVLTGAGSALERVR
ncbi:TPA: CDP-diacylglycerol diphosphatase [Stenotrophomonas maltophilia]|uniref:CDP-diacylglycerol diphosphatase n=1 Tax=Stenotrophomonas TaxID=40323 RepID=UPI0028A985A0|nr:CDP-diacylglycerol diphosphatase [Stenotrophomonas sp.]HDS0948819.1 CDP-diacylglycerol diphosphatase [Stenotrophomonas maltophilia]HDS1024875.1 CDP-diacylglycerol diphosphatase [Stenotrophomonas maltophilia]HDS1030501.1 CDP-diacylglycerol diphosphatase [Stenotrophomonas maltophilia]HDS1036288.1 CDP-diacylglycerol diphosphatase [Stenotrophomonas maltophilia]HDS1039619.1 CDP-diacylglycerol diphosphatase [Stenotrophomonas maltophilia]